MEAGKSSRATCPWIARDGIRSLEPTMGSSCGLRWTDARMRPLLFKVVCLSTALPSSTDGCLSSTVSLKWDRRPQTGLTTGSVGVPTNRLEIQNLTGVDASPWNGPAWIRAPWLDEQSRRGSLHQRLRFSPCVHGRL